jgi:mevalonate kinase
MKIGKGAGFGKVILLGEHFVVYGLPGIASGVSDTTEAVVEEGAKGLEFIDNRPETEGYKKTKKEEIEKSLKLILDFMKIDIKKTPVKITLSGNLLCTSGIGASAAMATSIARAFSDYFGLNLNDEQINRISYEGEKGAAGTPSGIDNTCATFGGLLWFQKNLEGGPNTIELIKIRKPVEIVLGNTGLSSVTSEVVADVRRANEANPAKFRKVFSDYVNTVKEARVALEGYDIKKLGLLMDKNQELLREIGVSCGEIEKIIGTAKKNGALGAKITGTGRGGYVIALTPGKSLQDKVAKAIKKAGFGVMKTSIGRSQ